ncbi:hypothetical protein HMPREF1052_0041 [Pasteurella bettyae CCUG 2042]|uniref:Uncharacterized protein n=1 Tax=Pasteurella bettyae CCUG 2042 TaxID=1095749 RepID=I3DI86_9PAST|nr:hypothetical protein HMPREF1052_0041 [Pasteurella bettyae CCUG 2042]
MNKELSMQNDANTVPSDPDNKIEQSNIRLTQYSHGAG